MAFSDRRVKRDIKKLGEFVKGISWYTFRYIGDARRSASVSWLTRFRRYCRKPCMT